MADEVDKLLKGANVENPPPAEQPDKETHKQTRLMQLVYEIQERYWGKNWSPDDRGTNTPQTTIVDWLIKERGLTKNEAQAVDKVACPIDRNSQAKQ